MRWGKYQGIQRRSCGWHGTKYREVPGLAHKCCPEEKKSSCPNLRCTSPLVLLIPQEHSSATHRSSERGTVFAAHVLQKRLPPLGWVKPGLLGLVCNHTISISFPSKTQKSYNQLGPILAFGLSFAPKVHLDPVLWGFSLIGIMANYWYRKQRFDPWLQELEVQYEPLSWCKTTCQGCYTGKGEDPYNQRHPHSRFIQSTLLQLLHCSVLWFMLT